MEAGSHNLAFTYFGQVLNECMNDISARFRRLDESLLIGETVVTSDDAARAADPVDEAADVGDLSGGGGGAQSGHRDEFRGRRPHADFCDPRLRHKPKSFPCERISTPLLDDDLIKFIRSEGLIIKAVFPSS